MSISGIIARHPFTVESDFHDQIKGHTYAVSSRFICTHLFNDDYCGGSRPSLEDINGRGICVRFASNQNLFTVSGDFIGIAPFYYYFDKEVFVFSDDLSELSNIECIPWHVDYSTVASFLLLGEFSKSEKSFISKINRLLPGEILTLDINKWQIQKSKRVLPKVSESEFSFSEWTIQNRESINSFIHKRFSQLSTHSHAVLLSGGLDSSIIGLRMSSFAHPSSLQYFTQINIKEYLNEEKYAQLIAAKYPDVTWHKVKTDQYKFLEDVENLHKVIEWPTLSTGTYNQYQLLKSCQLHDIEYVWDGLGADALYGGHDSYRYQLIAQYFKNVKYGAAIEALRWKGGLTSELEQFFKFHLKNAIFQNPLSYRLFLKWKGEMKLYNPTFLSSFLAMEMNKMKLKGKELKEQMNSDLFDGSVGHLARFTNRISTHCGVEMIYPFVENVEWANIIKSLPSDILFQGGRSKALLRESFKNELPHEIYSRKDKMGLPSPNNEWIEEHKDHWIQYFTDELSDIYDLDYLKSFYNKWWSIKGRSENYRHFRHISYAIWHKVWMKERRYPKSKS